MRESNEKIVSFLIVDIAGFTALTEIHGDYSAFKLVDKYNQIVNDSLNPEVFLVERKGDEFLIVSDCSDCLIKTALCLLRNVENIKNFPTIHIGLHIGKVIESGGKYYGHTLNLTSRISQYSNGGEILCSEAFLRNTINKELYNFIPKGKIKFKNVMKPISLYSIIPEIQNVNLAIDPICKMQIDIESTEFKYTNDQNEYYFCSQDCLEKHRQLVYEIWES
jgi:YHS domain-containing protein/class 3 adenylate cyclase